MTEFPIEALRSVDFVVPDLTRAVEFHTGVQALALGAGAGAAGVIGWAPRNEGKSLEEIQQERGEPVVAVTA